MERRLRKMTEPIHKGKDLPPVWVIHAASSGDSEAMEQVLRYYDDYMSRLCTCTLYDKDGTPHVCVDTHMKRCLETRLIWAVVRKWLHQHRHRQPEKAADQSGKRERLHQSGPFPG